MFNAASIHKRPAGLGASPFVAQRRRARRRPAAWARARPRLEGLEDRCLLSITEFPVPTASSFPRGITASPDGNLWFTEFKVANIGMINPATHAIAEYSIPYTNSAPNGITTGPDGNLWFTDRGNNAIGDIDPTTHAVTEFAVPSANAGPAFITSGPDGNLWFTEEGTAEIGMIDPATHGIAEFPVATANSSPYGITAGPDGNLWFTDRGNDAIGDINPTTHAVTEFAVPSALNSGLGLITTGPDGNLWFGEINDNQIGMINPTTHAITEFSVPGVFSGLEFIASGPDGNLWFTEFNASNIGMINPATHAIAEYSIPYTHSGPNGITTGPDGNLWFADPGSNAIGVATLARTHLVVTQQPPVSLTAGTPFGLTVTAEDSSGNLDSSFNGTVTVALVSNPGGARLGGTLTVTANQGVATFSRLSLTKAASGYTLSVSSSGVGCTTTSSIDVTPAAAQQWVIQTQPSTTATAGQAFAIQPVVKEVDQYGNLETGDNATVVTAALISGAGPLQGTITATVSGGMASFSNLADNEAETLSLNFTGGGLTSVPTSSLVVSPAAASQWVIQTQPSATATAGRPFAIQPVIYEEDQYGNLETGDNSTAVTAVLTSGAGPLQGTTTVTLSGGAANFTGLADNTAESMALSFNGGGFTSSPTNSIVVRPAAASQLVIQTQPSATATAGQPFAVQPVIYEEDPFGNLETGDSTTVVSAALNSGAGPLTGTTKATVSGGVAAFTNLADNKAETLSLRFSGGILTGPVSNSMVVSPAVASQWVIHTQPSAAGIAGQAFAAQPVVYEEDRFGNLETGDNNMVVSAALSSGSGPLQGTTTATVSGGVANFTSLADNKAETLSLQFSGGALTAATSTTIAVSPAPASQMVVRIQPSATAVAGQAFAIQPTLSEEDQYGNVETSDNGTVVTAMLHTGMGPLQGTTTATMFSGVATFSNLADNKAETITLTFTGGGLTTAPTSSITISPAAPSQLVIQTQPSATVLVRQVFGTQPVVVEEDRYGNLETGDNSTVVTATLDSDAGPLQGTATATVAGGVATFAGLADNRAESITLKFASGSLTPAISNPVVVSPAVDLAVSSFTRAPGLVEVGSDITYTVVVTNNGPSPATAVTITSPLGPGVSYVAGSGTGGIVSLRGSTVVASLGALASGASATVTFHVVPSLIGTQTGSASVSSPETDTDLSNDSASVSTTIVDRVGTIEFSAAGYSVAENAGSATITVNRVDGARGAVTVDYSTTPINAMPTRDYTPVSGTLTYPDGVTSRTIIVPVLSNPYDRHDERVSVMLSNVRTTETLGQAILGNQHEATLTIQDIDPNLRGCEKIDSDKQIHRNELV